MEDNTKRRGRPPKETAPLTSAERVAKHRARKRAEERSATENDPVREIARLREALEATRTTYATAAEKQRERIASIEALNLRLSAAEQERDNLRRERDILRDEIENIRDLMRGKLSDERIDDFFRRLYAARR